MKVPRKIKKHIPKDTPYCYTFTNAYKACRYYRHVEGIDGYCTLLKSDIMDQLKDCGINIDYNET